MQIVSSKFNQFANGDVIPLSWGLRMSFDKTFNDTTKMFVLDQSLLDGTDLLGPSDNNILQEWDKYAYANFTDNVVMIEWSREVDFPYSVSQAIADFTLDNTDDYFTPNSGSPIDQFILPRRPVRLLAGFDNETLPQFVGLTTKMPRINDSSKTAQFSAIDFLSRIFSMPLNEMVAMQDVRTDEVLEAIFTNFGLLPTQYNLAKGSNVIKFLFFDKGDDAGTVIRKLMEAEMGHLWLDELGIIRFDPRVIQGEAPVWTFDESNIINLSTTSDDDIINSIEISAELREVQAWQDVFQKTDGGDLIVIPPSSTRGYEASLKDPCLTVQPPTNGLASSVSWFTAVTPNGTPITSNVAVVSTELRTNNYLMVFQNNNAFPVEINQIELWGQPAKVYDEFMPYRAKETDSIDKYDEVVLKIDNNFIQDFNAADSLSRTILRSYSEYANIIEIDVKGNTALQLNDVINLDYLTYDGTYKIIKITNKLQSNTLTQNIKARKYTIVKYFTLDESLLDGPDVLAP